LAANAALDLGLARLARGRDAEARKALEGALSLFGPLKDPSGTASARVQLARLDRRAILADPELRRLLLDDLVGDLTPAVLERSFLYQLFQRWRPDIVVDCINTATAFAYQDIFQSARELFAMIAI